MQDQGLVFGAKASRRLEDGRILALVVQIFNVKLTVGPDVYTWDESW